MQTRTSAHPFISRLFVAVAALVALALLAIDSPAASATSGAQMVLNVAGGSCDDPQQPTACSVPAGEDFTLQVDVLQAPANGYILMQAYIDYGGDLLYTQQPASDEVVWPDLAASSAVHAEFGAGLVTAGGLTAIIPPYPTSSYEGTAVELQMTCSQEKSQTTVDLLPYNDPVAGVFGAEFVEPDGSTIVIPKVGSLAVDCAGEPPPPPPAPAEMALNLTGGVCDDPDLPTTCTVPAGATFTLTVNAVHGPANGYAAMSTLIDYGSDLSYTPGLVTDEVVWPDVHPDVAFRAQPGPGLVAHGGLTALVPPFPASTYEGAIVELQMTCSASNSQTTVDLLPYGDPEYAPHGALFVEPDGTTNVIPAVSGLDVACAASPPAPAEMALQITGAGVWCDAPAAPASCTVPVGQDFTLTVDVLHAPADGYVGMQTLIDYGADITYVPGPVAGELVWPDLAAGLALRATPGPGFVAHAGLTGLVPPFPTSTFEGTVVQLQMTCSAEGSESTVELLPLDNPVHGPLGAMFIDPDGVTNIVPAVDQIAVQCVQDTDGDGCSAARENGADEMTGGLRDDNNPYDFYDTNGNRRVDLPNDILGVIARWSANPQQPYDAIYDRGPSEGPNAWNMTAPDGHISLTIDILGVVRQWQHHCD